MACKLRGQGRNIGGGGGGKGVPVAQVVAAKKGGGEGRTKHHIPPGLDVGGRNQKKSALIQPTSRAKGGKNSRVLMSPFSEGGINVPTLVYLLTRGRRGGEESHAPQHKKKKKIGYSLHPLRPKEGKGGSSYH